MSIRFAFDDIANYFSGPNMGALAQGGTDLDSRLRSAGTELLGKVGSYGLLALGKAKSGGILGDATSDAATSALIGSLASTAGRVGGTAMAYGDFGRPSMDSPISGVDNNPIPGQTTDVIRGAQGTIVDPSMTGVPDYTISPGFSGDRLIIG
jgi:hypothetical protein